MCHVCAIYVPYMCHFVGGRNPAPPNTSWNDDSHVNTDEQWFQAWFQSANGFFSIHRSLRASEFTVGVGWFRKRPAKHGHSWAPLPEGGDSSGGRAGGVFMAGAWRECGNDLVVASKGIFGFIPAFQQVFGFPQRLVSFRLT